MAYYKLINQKMQTHNGFQWELNKWYTIPKRNRGRELCTKSWFHCYNNSLLAILLNPVHADIANPRLFRCNVRGMKREDNGLKFGFTQMRLVEQLEVREITTTQCVAFGILCTKEICNDKSWNKWADNWLSGEDRTKSSAWFVCSAGGSVAESGVYAANAAAYAVDAASAAADAAYAADAASVAAWSVACAASVVARSAIEINLIALAKEAMKYE